MGQRALVMAKQLYTHWVELITAESAESRFVRHRRIIRFPQLTMPLIAAYTPAHWRGGRTHEIVHSVPYAPPLSLGAITPQTAAPPPPYQLAATHPRPAIPPGTGGRH